MHAAHHGARGAGARAARGVGAGAARAAAGAGRRARPDGAAARAPRVTSQARGTSRLSELLAKLLMRAHFSHTGTSTYVWVCLYACFPI